MSATEIIEQIKTLPKDERQRVFAYVHRAGDTSATPGVRFADDEEARQAGEAVVTQYPEVFRRLAE